MKRALPFVAAVALSCSGPRPAPPSPRPTPPPGEASATPTAEEPRAVAHEVVAAGSRRELPAYVHMARGADRAWLVHDVPDAEATILAPLRADGVGPPRWLDGRLAVAAARRGEAWLVLRVGDALCLLPPDGPRVCHEDTSAKAAVALPDGLALVSAPRRVIQEGRGPSKRRAGAAPVAQDPVEMVVRVQRFDETGTARGAAVDSGLRFDRPLEGMGLVDATATEDAIAILYYEQAKPRRDGRKTIPQARLRAARLDLEGSLVAGSKKTLYEGDRRFGYVEGYHRPRVFGRGDEALAVVRFVERDGGKVTSGWKGWALPTGRAVTGPGAWFGLRPRTLVEPPDAALKDRLAALWKHAPRLLPGQAGSDAGRVAWIDSRGWFLLDGALHFVDADHLEPTPHPGLEASRADVAWSLLDANGRGWAQTHLGLVTPDGLVDTSLPMRRDASVGNPAVVGGALWLARRSGGRGGAQLVAADGRQGPEVPVGHFAVVGGAPGMLLTRDGARLAVGAWTGPTVKPVVTMPTPVRGWFAAVAHHAGALLVGEPRVGEELVAMVVGRDGVLGEPRPLAAKAPSPSLRRTALRPLPGGSAVLATAEDWVWLGPDGAVTGRAPRPAGHPCAHGRSPARVPGLRPGSTLPWPADLCLRDAPTVLRDGRVAAFAVRRDGVHEDVVRVRLGEPVVAPSASETVAFDADAVHDVPLRHCPPDMVDVGGAFCIDRFEGYLTDDAGLPLSPDYPPTPGILDPIFKAWSLGRFYEGDLAAHAWPLPPLGRSVDASPVYVARNALGATPSGFLTGYAAKKACEAAGKRLCSHTEWERACKGEDQTKFPYGDDYEHGRCNVFRFTHPARVLHDNPSVGHLDPRLNHIGDDEGPLRLPSGSRRHCASRWGDDAVYDMVGNLDEWFGGRGDSGFAGGFYARSTRQGCEAVITVHPRRYLDYSLGVRCCAGTSP